MNSAGVCANSLFEDTDPNMLEVRAHSKGVPQNDHAVYCTPDVT